MNRVTRLLPQRFKKAINQALGVQSALGLNESGINSSLTSASTAGGTSVEPYQFKTTMTGAGGVGGRSLFRLDTNVVLGGWANAAKAITVFGAAGRVTGLGSAIVAEMVMSAGTTAGTYAPLEIEFGFPANAECTGTTSFIAANTYGDDRSEFDDKGHFAQIGGLTAGTAGQAKAFTVPGGSYVSGADISHGLRIRIGAANYYVPLVPSADFLDTGG